jgi:dihydroflavonol-4-reductase
MPVLVTGATGFVGSAVVRALLAQGQPVRALARAGSDRRNLADLKVEIVTGDLTDRASLERAAKGCEALFHVAADYRLWVPNPPEIYRANVDGTRALMEAAAAAGVRRIVYTSSVATLGLDPGGTPANEDTPVTFDDMIGHYKRSKFLAEDVVRELARQHRLPAVIVNPSTPIGPRDIRPTPTGRMIVDAASGRIPAYLDTGLNIVHVDDVAAGHLAAYERGRVGERYVLGGFNMALAEILAAIARLVGRKPPTVKLPRLAVLPVAYAVEAWARLTRMTAEPLITVDGVKLAAKRMYFSSAKAERELGYVMRPAEAAIADAVAWFRANGYCR